MENDTQTSIDGIIKNARHLKNGCVFGTVVKDYKGRFDPGNWIRTSLVQSVEGDLIYTRNSVYKFEGELVVEDKFSFYDAI